MSTATHQALEDVFQTVFPEALWTDVCKCEFTGLEDYARTMVQRSASENYFCANCLHRMHVWTYDPMKVTSEFDEVESKRIQDSDTSFWHMTNVLEWGDKYGIDFTDLHCGNQVTAWARGFDVVLEQKLPTPFLHEYPFFLYELKKTEDCVMNEYIDDLGQDWGFADPNTAYPYVNAHEFAGSHSFYAHTSAFEVVNMSEVFLPEMFDTLMDILY